METPEDGGLIPFYVSRLSGDIYTIRELDPEISQYNLNVFAENKESDIIQKSETVRVVVRAIQYSSNCRYFFLWMKLSPLQFDSDYRYQFDHFL